MMIVPLYLPILSILVQHQSVGHQINKELELAVGLWTIAIEYRTVVTLLLKQINLPIFSKSFITRVLIIYNYLLWQYGHHILMPKFIFSQSTKARSHQFLFCQGPNSMLTTSQNTRSVSWPANWPTYEILIQSINTICYLQVRSRSTTL